MPLILLLNAQVNTVIQQTEDAAADLGTRFCAIATRATPQSKQSATPFLDNGFGIDTVL